MAAEYIQKWAIKRQMHEKAATAALLLYLLHNKKYGDSMNTRNAMRQLTPPCPKCPQDSGWHIQWSIPALGAGGTTTKCVRIFGRRH